MSTSALRLPQRVSFQAIAWSGALLVGASTIVLNSSELGGIIHVFSGAQASYLLILLLVRGVFTINMGLCYASTFRAAGLKAERHRFVLISWAGNFLNQVTKSSGFGGLPLFLREGARNGDGSLKVTAAYMAGYAMSYIAYLVILVLALVMLYARGSLTTTEAIASGVLFVFILTAASLLVAGFRSETTLYRLAWTALKPINAIGSLLLKRPLMAKGSIEHTLNELYQSAHLMLGQRRRFVLPFAHWIALELLSVATLFLVARTLHAGIGFELATAGYALALLSGILSITPSGLGFVEASLAVFLGSTGLSRQQAVAVTLGYRFFDFWLPVATGAVCALYLRLPRKEATV